MSSRDDIPKPSGSLTAEQKQAMARIEMRRAERLRAESDKDAGVGDAESSAPLSLLDEAVETSDSIDWSLEETEPPAPVFVAQDPEEVDASENQSLDLAGDGGDDIELTTPGLAVAAAAPADEGAAEPIDLSAKAASAEQTPAPLLTPESGSSEEQNPSEPDDVLPTVSEVARDASDYQALRASKSPMKRLVDDLSSRMFKNSAGMVATAAAVSIAAALLIWSVFFRLDILDEVVALEMLELDLEDQHATLALQLSALNSESMESEIAEQSTRIFPGFPALANWIERVSERAEGMNMNVRYRVEPASYAPVDEVLEVPVIIELEVASDDDGELFSRGMGLIASLLQDHWHLDIASTSAEGDGKGMRTLEMEARVWVFDVEEFVSSSLVADRDTSDGSSVASVEFGGDAEIIQ
ncbi:MAG: hypothetical protein NXH85_06820 [Pseudomonadaceae bacterium]|nr:hypothetical protein [Pseudomonadaceae bacterium]